MYYDRNYSPNKNIKPLNLVQGQKFAPKIFHACFDNLIQLHPLLSSVLDLCVHDLISCDLFHAVWIKLYWCELFCNVIIVRKWWKVWPKVIYIEEQVQTKEWWDDELKYSIPNGLGDGVRLISWWAKLAVASNNALLLQMQPNIVTHLEFVWHSMLIMSLLVLSIGSVQYIMDLLADVLNMLNEAVSHFSFGLHVSRIYLSGCKWYGPINGA